MLVVTLQRNKCIGCNYCRELSPDFFVISKKDGKSVLLNAIEKKSFYMLKVRDERYKFILQRAAEACPVRIIKVNETGKHKL